MFHFAVVEDTEEDAQNLMNCLKRYQEENGEKLEVEWFRSAVLFLDSLKTRDFSAVFMDVDMPDMSGMKASHRLREMGNEMVLVFVTNLAQYAIEGYEVNALDFILKPVNYFSFRMKMRRILQAARLNDTKERVIWINGDGEKHSVKESEIAYVEVQAHDILYHMTGRVIRGSGSLKQIEQELNEDTFFRCNYCYLVNLSHVKGINGNEVQVGADWLQISRNRKKEFLDKVTSFFGRGGN